MTRLLALLALVLKSALWWALAILLTPLDLLTLGVLDLHFWPERHACWCWRRAKGALRGQG